MPLTAVRCSKSFRDYSSPTIGHCKLDSAPYHPTVDYGSQLLRYPFHFTILAAL
jgi:hypothetical protein